MKAYLPKKLNLEEHLKNHPPTSIDNFHIDNLYYILGLITEIPAKSEHFDSHTGMVQLNAETLRMKVRNYNQYLGYAVATGILESDNHYIPGEKSRGYRFAEKYWDKVAPVTIVKYSLVKNHRKRKIDPKVEKAYGFLTKWFNDDLEIDHTGAVEFLESTISGDENISKFNYNRCRIDMLNDKEYYMSMDGKGKRFHSNLTGFRSDLRNFISYAGKGLVGVDIRNSQPYMSITLFNQMFYNSNLNSNILKLSDIYSNSIISPSSYYFPSLMLYKLLEEANNQDVNHYIDLVIKGELYEYLKKHFQTELGKVYKNRKELKDDIFLVFYSSNYLINQPYAGSKRVFRKLFPTVYRVFACIKTVDHSKLPILLQQIESHIVLDRICRRITKERPNLPIFTIHDNVITTIGDEDYIETVMREELTLCIGYEPRFKIEYWRNND
ncbi:MAG: hypothetical protein JXA38_06865 [Methanosarcinaceae archaeon]|nr:hypothetical protein [Methanosarcinaceae archaeon]